MRIGIQYNLKISIPFSIAITNLYCTCIRMFNVIDFDILTTHVILASFIYDGWRNWSLLETNRNNVQSFSVPQLQDNEMLITFLWRPSCPCYFFIFDLLATWVWCCCTLNCSRNVNVVSFLQSHHFIDLIDMCVTNVSIHYSLACIRKPHDGNM